MRPDQSRACHVWTVSSHYVKPAKKPTEKTPSRREVVYSSLQRSVFVRSRAEVIITHTPSTSDACPIHRVNCQSSPSILLTHFSQWISCGAPSKALTAAFVRTVVSCEYRWHSFVTALNVWAERITREIHASHVKIEKLDLPEILFKSPPASATSMAIQYQLNHQGALSTFLLFNCHPPEILSTSSRTSFFNHRLSRHSIHVSSKLENDSNKSASIR
jgi:hypothetical protein